MPTTPICPCCKEKGHVTELSAPSHLQVRRFLCADCEYKWWEGVDYTDEFDNTPQEDIDYAYSEWELT